MSIYRRARGPGGTYFFTVVTYRRRKIFADPVARTLLREAIMEVRAYLPFTIDAWVLLPEHLHCVWTLPPDDMDFSIRWGKIKAGFTKRSKDGLHRPELLTNSRKKHRESTIWQRRFWEHKIRNSDDYRRHLDYIHYNPVKHGLVAKVRDWPYSTFHRLVREGVYPENWGQGPELSLDTVGE